MNNTISSNIEKTDLPLLKIKWKTTLPIVQWWMWVGISTWRLAWSVAKLWWVGTLSAVWHSSTPAYSHVLKEAISKKKLENDWEITSEDLNKLFYDSNIECIKQEILQAKNIAEGRGSIFINVMVATNDYDRQVLAACEAWIDGIVSGAGLPLSLPELTSNYPNVALIPILSNLRWVKILIKKWEKQWRIPDAIVLEDPSRAGWHLWAASTYKVNDPESTLEVAVPEVIEYLKQIWLDIPVIAAWWIVDRDDIDKLIGLWASWVQIGTRFLATNESSASDEFKEGIINAWEKDIITYVSNAMLPARALKESWIFSLIKDKQAEVKKCVENCLVHCAYRDWIWVLKNTGESPAQMCILHALSKATHGNKPEAKKWALYFTWISALRINTIKSVEEVMSELISK